MAQTEFIIKHSEIAKRKRAHGKEKAAINNNVIGGRWAVKAYEHVTDALLSQSSKTIRSNSQITQQN